MYQFLKSQFAVALTLVVICSSPIFAQSAAESQGSSRDTRLKRISYEIKYLSTDEMGGRQPGKPGMKLAEQFIVKLYKEAGLIPPAGQENYFQEFKVGGERSLVKEKAVLKLKGPKEELNLELDTDFSVLIGRRDYELDAELVFVGYGINAKNEHNYNEFRDIDVEGKIVVMLRREPQQDNPDSVFDGKEVSKFAYIRPKIANARRAKAAGILFVNDLNSSPTEEKDELSAYDQFGTATQFFPFMHIKQSVFNKMLKANPLVVGDGIKLSSLKQIEARIDDTMEPVSQPLKGWTANMQAAHKLEQVKTNNIIGVIEGEGPNADETIVIGAHYDHLGVGEYGSRAQDRMGEIHNGADDNATGTIALVELARRFNARDKKPGRRLVFIAFSAEEMGLIGARHYVQNPPYPLDKTVAMVNFDMIGWLRDDKLTIYNWNSSPQFEAILDAANESSQLVLDKPRQLSNGSDHAIFFQANIPDIFIHTGRTPTYHTPDDDFETLDCDGALRVIDYSEHVLDGLAKMEKPMTFGLPKPVRLGVMLSDENNIVTVDGVTDDSIASKSGLKKGDVILKFADLDITKRRQVTTSILRNAGKTVKVKIKRGDTEMTLNVVLKRD